MGNTKLGKLLNFTTGFTANAYLYTKAGEAMFGDDDKVEIKGILDKANQAAKDAEAAMKAGDKEELKKLQAELEQLKKQAEDAAGKAKGKIRRVGGMRLRGAKFLQGAGYGADLNPSTDYRQIYDQFYSALDKAGIGLKKDYLFGRKHRAAFKALQGSSKIEDKKDTKNDMSSTNVKPAGTPAPMATAIKAEKPVEMVERYTFKSTGEAIEGASRGKLDPAYRNRPGVMAAIRKYKQS